MSRYERDKGFRVEREVVNLLREAGIHAERVPLSGASRYRNEGHDVNVYAFGRDEKPLVFEVKARKEGAGFALLKRWLGEHDGLVTREDRADPLVTLKWSVLITLLEQLAERHGGVAATTSIQPMPKNGQDGATCARPEAKKGDGNEHPVER